MTTRKKWTSMEAKKCWEETTGIYISDVTFREWLRKWTRQYPDMVIQPVRGGRFHIDPVKFRGFCNEKN